MKQMMTTMTIAILFLAHNVRGDYRAINTNEAYDQLMQQKGRVVLKCAASWCGICNRTKDAFESMAKDNRFKDITFARVDADAVSKIKSNFNISGYPTIFFLADGKKKKEKIGVHNIGDFKNELAAAILDAYDIKS